MKRRAREIGKTVVIASLVCSASFMLYLLLSIASGLTSGGSESVYRSAGSESVSAVETMPRAIAVKNGSGRFGAEYSRSVVREIYTRAKNALQRWDGADYELTCEKTTLTAWVSALARDGVYIDFGAAVPSELLGETPCVQALDGYKVRSMMISDGADGVTLTFTDGVSYYAARTDAASGFSDGIDASEGWETDFAGLLDASYSGVRPDFMISGEPSPPALRRVDGDPADVSRIVDIFAIDRYTAGSYTDEKGAQVYLGQDSTLTVSKTEVTYVGGDGLSVPSITGSAETGARERLRAAASLVYGVAGRYTRDAEFYCVSADADEAGLLTVAFGMRAYGVPITRADGGDVFAVVCIDGDRITSARIRLAGYIAIDGDGGLLAPRYAAALRGDIRAYYGAEDGDTFYPDWYENETSAR